MQDARKDEDQGRERLGLVLRLALGLDVFGAMAIEGQMKVLMMEIQVDNVALAEVKPALPGASLR